jgi:hypothetical protein
MKIELFSYQESCGPGVLFVDRSSCRSTVDLGRARAAHSPELQHSAASVDGSST